MGDFFGVFIVVNIVYAISLVFEQASLKLAKTVFYVLAASINSVILFQAKEGIQNSNTSQIVAGALLATVAWFFLYRYFDASDSKKAKDKEVEKQRVDAMSPEEWVQHRKETLANEKKAKAAENEKYHGRLNKQLVCPHCQTKGFVRKQSKTRVTKTRVNSVAARAVGLGTNTENKVTAMRCDNCETEWDVA